MALSQCNFWLEAPFERKESRDLRPNSTVANFKLDDEVPRSKVTNAAVMSVNR
jgi:hypothetical protein